MSYTALYRKWRPATFDEVKGQDHIVQTLKNQIIANRVGHAYLFCGTRGTGKTSIAKIYAKAVNCEQPVSGSPCNECPTCRAIGSSASMNVVEIDAASNNGVENIRDIREQVQYPPTDGKYRVYIIDEVHMLSIGAFNALLKTLEEPPGYVIFILATTEVHKIPVTILSRCQRYDFKRIPVAVLADQLRKVAKSEGVEIEERAINYLAKGADGAFRDALSLLDQCTAFHFEGMLTYNHVLDILGAVDQTIFSRLFQAVAGGQTKAAVLLVEEMVIQGRELGQFVNDFIWYLRNLLLLRSTKDADGLVDVSDDSLQQMQQDTKLMDEAALIRDIRIFSELSNQLRYASQKRVLIEIALIKLTNPQMETSLDAVIARLSKLEQQMEEGIAYGPDSRHMPPVQPQPQAHHPAGGEAEVQPELPREKVVLPKAQAEDLKLIRNEWGNIICQMGMSVRPSFRDTVVEPSGDNCLTISFSDPVNFAIGSRPSVIGGLERYVAEKYGKTIYFKTRQRQQGEGYHTLYLSEEELKDKIKTDIVIEEE